MSKKAPSKRLNLNTETLRTLHAEQLVTAAGGMGPTNPPPSISCNLQVCLPTQNDPGL